MKVTYRQWMYFRDKSKEELGKLDKSLNPKAVFTKKWFEWDFHHIYPPSTTRLHFEYNEQTEELSGYRGPNWTEGPFGPQKVSFDEKYLRKVTGHFLKELAKIDKKRGLTFEKGRQNGEAKNHPF